MQILAYKMKNTICSYAISLNKIDYQKQKKKFDLYELKSYTDEIFQLEKYERLDFIINAQEKQQFMYYYMFLKT